MPPGMMQRPPIGPLRRAREFAGYWACRADKARDAAPLCRPAAGGKGAGEGFVQPLLPGEAARIGPRIGPCQWSDSLVSGV